MTNKNSNKNDNKSLFIYAALIFFVAVILIILSFFGQTNLKKNMPKVDENTEQIQGITERSALLSEENKNLLEENKQLKAENEELQNKQLENDLLLSANGYFIAGNNAKAFEMLNAVNYDTLTSDQKIIYDNIKNNLQ